MFRAVTYKEYNSIDILKFVLSIFVMMIHSGMDKTLISPLLRTAVPLFFIISGFFFFQKTKKLSDGKEKISALWHFVKRNLFLYLFWTILQMPIWIYTRGYYRDLFPNGFFSIIKDFFLGSGFTGSWYIPALILGTIIIFFLSKKIPAGVLILITLPLYVICCFYTNYWNLLDSNSILVKFNEFYQNTTGLHFYTGLPVSLFWISIGNFFAKKEILIKTRYLIICLTASALFIAIERYLILKYQLATIDDCYFTLILLCPLIFLIVNRHSITFKSRIRVREISTIIYVVHGSCERIVGFALKKIPFETLNNEIIKIIIAFAMIMFLSGIILYLRDKRVCKLLKYAC